MAYDGCLRGTEKRNTSFVALGVFDQRGSGGGQQLGGCCSRDRQLSFKGRIVKTMQETTRTEGLRQIAELQLAAAAAASNSKFGFFSNAGTRSR